MKRLIFSLITVAALLAACQKPEIVDPTDVVESVQTQFVALIDGFDVETKTSMDADRNVLWSLDDHIAIFRGSTLGEEYKLDDAAAGQGNGVFNPVGSVGGDPFFASTEIPCNVGFYPYASNLSLARRGEAYEICNVEISSLQTYTPGTFANGAFPMVAYKGDTESNVLEFKNILGVVKLQFKGNAFVKSVKIEGKNDEVLSGSATVAVFTDNQTPAISMVGTAASDKSVVLECPMPVQLSETEVTEFHIAIPPVTFSNGFKVTLTDILGNTKTVESTVENAVLRSTVLAMPEIEVKFDYPEEPAFDFDIKLFVDENVTKKGLMQESVTLLSATYTKKETGKPYYPAVKEWKSSAPDIASVDADGNVTAVAEHIEKSGFENGKKVLITHVVDGRESTVELTIVKMLPTSIQLTAVPEVNGVKNKMLHGDSFKFEFKVLPEKASQSVVLQGGITLDKPQSDFKLEHENNTYVAENVGYANFTAYARDNSSVRIDFAVEVLPIVLQDLTLSYSELEMAPGSKAVLGVTYIPENTSDKTIVWTSSDEAVASVNEKGEVMAHQVGEAVITAKHKESNIEKTCKIKVEIPQLNFNIGDYYYSTGKISSSPDEDESEYGKVVGVIFSSDNPALQGDPDLGKDHPQATHGLVVALKETASIQWQASSSDVGQWLIDNTGYNYLKDTDRKCGYSNTLGLRAYNAACALENKVLVADCAPDIELGSETSGWYLPSYAELNMLFSYEQSTRSPSAMISNGAIAQKIEAAGGTPFSIEKSSWHTPDGVEDAPTYWSSTESSINSFWATGVHFLYGGATNKSKTGKSYYIARYIFAF